MIQTRRSFVGTLGFLALAAASGISFVTGCSTATIAAALISSFGQVLKLLQSAGVLTNNQLIEAANAALSAFSAAYDAYEADKNAGTLAALGAAAQAALSAVQTFLNETNFGGVIAQTAAALLEIILSTLMSFLPSPAPASFKLKGAHESATSVHPVKRTRTQFVKAWNSACKQYNVQQAEIK